MSFWIARESAETSLQLAQDGPKGAQHPQRVPDPDSADPSCLPRLAHTVAVGLCSHYLHPQVTEVTTQ
jgi:hypothetical protein